MVAASQNISVRVKSTAEAGALIRANLVFEWPANFTGPV
jgi:hypothetical protein